MMEYSRVQDRQKLTRAANKIFPTWQTDGAEPTSEIAAHVSRRDYIFFRKQHQAAKIAASPDYSRTGSERLS